MRNGTHVRFPSFVLQIRQSALGQSGGGYAQEGRPILFHNLGRIGSASCGEAFLAVNPTGAIPALLDHEAGEGTADPSLAILEYREDVAPNPVLLPTDPLGRRRVRSLSLLLAADTPPMITPRTRRYQTEQEGFTPERWRARQTQWFTTGLQALEKRLTREPGTGAFCHGDPMTMAGVCLASIIAVMRVFGITAPGIPTVERIKAACEVTDAFSQADPRKRKGAPE